MKGIIRRKEKKLRKVKCDECEVLMREVVGVVIRGMVGENVGGRIRKVCGLMKGIWEKVMDGDRLEGVENEVVECVVSFELIFGG